jgi:hypothetical protein
MRVLFAALALSALSFAAGIAGDLSIAAPSPPSVILRLPPIPANAVRAHPLPPLPVLHAVPAVAHSETTRLGRNLRLEAIVARTKPQTMQVFAEVKCDPDRAPKDDGLASAQI